MTDLQMWNLVTGFLSATFIIPVIQQPQWSPRVRAVVTFVYCLIVGVVTAYMTGGFDGVHDIRTGVASVLLMLVTAIASYKGFAQPTRIAPAIEYATSPTLPGGD